jgi:hypothetical protein
MLARYWYYYLSDQRQDNQVRSTNTYTDLQEALERHANKKIDITPKAHTNLALTTVNGFHIYRQRRIGNKPSQDNLKIADDPAYQSYEDYLRTRGNNRGILSKSSVSQARCSVIHFLQFCNLPITNHTLNDLVAYKQANPNSSEIEQAIRKFISQEHQIKRTTEATYILGIFNRGNFTPLHIHVNSHFVTDHKEIPETTLKEIYAGCPDEEKNVQDLQAHLGERRGAIMKITPDQINFDLDKDLAAIFFNGTTTKCHIRHFSLCPKPIIEKTLEIMKDTQRTTAFPNFKRHWDVITKFAQKEFKVKYTSHYLRRRFETIADDSGISMNKISFLMGGSPPHGSDDLARLGHLPQIYVMKSVPKIAAAYKQYLQQKLDLTH